ncbi:MAG: hypothetical protein DRG39_04505, partial [Deltaproteobacteria bacterium]
MAYKITENPLLALAKPPFIPNNLLISLKNKACFLRYKTQQGLLVRIFIFTICSIGITGKWNRGKRV